MHIHIYLGGWACVGGGGWVGVEMAVCRKKYENSLQEGQKRKYIRNCQ